MSAFTITATLVRTSIAAESDPDGNDVLTLKNIKVPGCVFIPSGSTEIVGNRNTVTQEPHIHMPPNPVKATDRVILPGLGTFEVDGEPNRWPQHPMTGWRPARSVDVRLKQVTG